MATAVFSPASGSVSPVDGFVRRHVSNLLWPEIRDNPTGNESGVVDIACLTNFSIYANGSPDRYLQLGRIFLLFDTSSLGNGVTIDSGTISLRGLSKFKDAWTIDDNIHVTSSSPATNDTLTNNDYPSVGSVSFGSVSYADFSTSGYNNIALNASGLANISKTGVSKFAIRWGADLTNTPPTWADSAQLRANFRLADNTGSSEDPVLTVNYTVLDPVESSPSSYSKGVTEISKINNLTL